MSHRPQEVAVLASGGIDSAILCVEMTRCYDRVHPIFVRFGLRWEDEELSGLESFLGRVARPGLLPLTVLDLPVADVYGDHWSLGVGEVPDHASPDESVELPGRNLLLLAKAAVFCLSRDIGTIAVGSLAANPFPDSTPEFDRALERALGIGLGTKIRLIRPFSGMTKVEVLHRGAGLPLGATMSCLDPRRGAHCGVCNKCEERRRAFAAAGMADPTHYAESAPLGR